MAVSQSGPESAEAAGDGGLRGMARRWIPFPLRVELARLRRWPQWQAERPHMALSKLTEAELSSWTRVFAYRSPLRRASVSDEALQRGKEANVGLAARAIDRIVLAPHQVFSYHHAVGRPTRMRGFRRGLELHAGQMESGIGGGCCQVSNLLYWVALNGGLEIVERHRHALDLFPDHGRTVPFGCGATVFYNLSDLRIRNPHSVRIALRLELRDGFLDGNVASETPLECRFEVYESDHRFVKEGDGWFRQNRIWRRTVGPSGETVVNELIAENYGRCLYDPEAPPE